MLLPRFRLRTLLIVVALFSVPLAWVGYQLEWIRQRRAMLGIVREVRMLPRMYDPDAPRNLRIFGERGVGVIFCAEVERDAAQQLFPETTIITDVEALSSVSDP